MNCNTMAMGNLASGSTIFKRKFRWMLRIQGMSGDTMAVLPPLRGARPDLEFKDIEVPHMIEDVFIPGKPTWKPINLVLYDICIKGAHKHPIWEWILMIYDPSSPNGGYYGPILDSSSSNSILGGSFKRDANLELYSGCGDIVEKWTFQNAYPSQVNFGELDMSNAEVITCDVTLKYDRAYLTLANNA
jgi:hypothetical protein